MTEETQKKPTEGKKLGRVAFWLTECLMALVILVVLIDYFIWHKFDPARVIDVVKDMVTAQTFVLGITWGAKASSNFAKRGGANGQNIPGSPGAGPDIRSGSGTGSEP